MNRTFNQTKTAAASKTTAKRASAKPRKTVVEDAVYVEPQPQATTPEAEDSAYAKMMDSVNGYFAARGMPTWKRQVTSFALGLITYAGVFYTAMQLVDILALAAVMYTGMGFITFLTVFIGFVLALMAASTAGFAVYNAAMTFEYTNVKARVTDWFGSFKSKEPAHA
jgi:hypothetical protein